MLLENNHAQPPTPYPTPLPNGLGWDLVLSSVPLKKLPSSVNKVQRGLRDSAKGDPGLLS